MDMIKQLIAETHNSLSGVAYRNLGEPGNNVSVKYIDNQGYSPNRFQWRHRDLPITESQARTLLRELEQKEKALNHEQASYAWVNGWTMKRETGVVYLPESNGFGVDAYGKWVLRDERAQAVAMDKSHHALLDRYVEQIGHFIGYVQQP